MSISNTSGKNYNATRLQEETKSASPSAFNAHSSPEYSSGRPVVAAASSAIPLSHRDVQASSDKSKPAGEKSASNIFFENTKRQIINLNSQIVVNDELIRCGQLTAKYIMTCRQRPHDDVDPDELFGSKEHIQRSMRKYKPAQSNWLLATACGKHIIANDKFGAHLSAWAKKLASGEKRWYMLMSGEHVMSFQLHNQSIAKVVNGDLVTTNKYSVRFFDPNLTNTILRCEVGNPDDLDSPKYALKQFMEEINYKSYFGDKAENECAIYDCSDPLSPAFDFGTVETASPKGVSPIMLFHLLVDGRAPSEIRAVAESLKEKSLPLEDLKALLAAKRCDGIPGLHSALLCGNAAAVLAYGELLQLVPVDKRAQILPELIAAKSRDGSSGLFMALQHSSADTVKAYGELLKLVPADKLVEILPEILAAKRADGIPGLHMALQNGHAGTIKAYGELLQLIPADKRAQILPTLLEAKRTDGVSGLLLALQNGHTDAVKAYGELLQLIPVDKRAQILPGLMTAKSPTGASILPIVLADGHFKTIQAYIEMINSLSMRDKLEDEIQ